VYYDPASTTLRADALWHADQKTGETFGAGDVFKAGLRFKSNDSGAGSIQVGLVSWRNLCLNLIIIDEAYKAKARVIHRGSMAANLMKFSRAANQALGKMDKFLAHWGVLLDTPAEKIIDVDAAIDEHGSLTAMAIMSQFRTQFLPADVQRDVTVERLLSHHVAEGNGDLTAAALINAVTRVHEDSLVHIVARESAEQRAGLLVPKFAAMVM